MSEGMAGAQSSGPDLPPSSGVRLWRQEARGYLFLRFCNSSDSHAIREILNRRPECEV